MRLRTTLPIIPLAFGACGPSVDPGTVPTEPGPIEGTIDPYGHPGSAGIGVEPRGQLASVTACDVDGDGLDDLVVLSNLDSVPLHVVHGRREPLNRRVAIDEVGTSIRLDGDATLQCLGDLDDDGSEELSLCGHLGDRTACRIARFPGDGSSIDYALELDLGPEAFPFYPVVQVLDLDADGTLDLYVDVPLWDQPLRYLIRNVAAEFDTHDAPLERDSIDHRVDGVGVERPADSQGFTREVRFADLDADGTLERFAAHCPGPSGNCAGGEILIGTHDHQVEDLLQPVPVEHVWTDLSPYLGTVGDINGDGIDDFGFSTFDEAFIAFGPLDYTQPLPPQSILLPDGGLRPLGDINGDGVEDAASQYWEEGNDGMTTKLITVTASPTVFASFYLPGLTTIEPAGDFNGDGFDDFVVWDPDRFALVYGHPG